MIISIDLADRAKNIKTKATINETATDKLIRELREENAKLLEMIQKGQLVGGAPTNLQEGGGGASNTDSEGNAFTHYFELFILWKI